jgi:hypothetical protein
MATIFVPCTLENIDGVEYSVIAEVVTEPAQNGGMTDPSWDAYWDVHHLTNAQGVDILETLSVDDAESINQQVIQYFEDISKDMY